MFAPKIAKNLVSRPTLNRMGYKLEFEYDQCVISRDGVFIRRCYLNCNLFKLSIKTYLDKNLFHVYDNNVNMYELWHNRLCHVNYESMKYMGKLDIIPMCGFDYNNVVLAC